ncbi:MAG: hypothetical protein ACJAW1_002156 [Glaciecola sp.]|jgi:hypothetical protein
MVELVHIISQRIARYLEKVGLVERDMENSSLNLPLDDEVNPDGQFIAVARRPSGLTQSATASPWGLNKEKKCLHYKP